MGATQPAFVAQAEILARVARLQRAVGRGDTVILQHLHMGLATWAC